jgi:hypothetical protein
MPPNLIKNIEQDLSVKFEEKTVGKLFQFNIKLCTVAGQNS